MTGREKIEAALSPAGTAQIPVVICYEGIYIRDHQDDFAPVPWWYAQAPDLERQLEYRRRVLALTGHDWFDLTPCAPRAERQSLRLEEQVHRLSLQYGRAQEVAHRVLHGLSPLLAGRARVNRWSPASASVKTAAGSPVPFLRQRPPRSTRIGSRGANGICTSISPAEACTSRSEPR